MRVPESKSMQSYIQSAVIVPVYRDLEGKLRVIIIRRSVGGIHGGQLAFPGGKRERQDCSMLEAALRETREEIGVVVSLENVLATLPVVETRSSGFRIHPFLARIERPQAWQLDAREVAEILEVDVARLAHPETVAEESVHFEGWDAPQTIRFYKIGPHRFWGASYRILAPLVPRLIAQEWDL